MNELPNDGKKLALARRTLGRGESRFISFGVRLHMHTEMHRSKTAMTQIIV